MAKRKLDWRKTLKRQLAEAKAKPKSWATPTSLQLASTGILFFNDLGAAFLPPKITAEMRDFLEQHELLHAKFLGWRCGSPWALWFWEM